MGHDVKFVYRLDACHTDPNIWLQEGLSAVLWAFDERKKKLEVRGKEEEVASNATSDVVQGTFTIVALLIVVVIATIT